MLSYASTDIIFNSRVATTLSGVNVYPDSSFEIQSTGSLKGGQLVEITGETSAEYDDASQNQKFKWYKVKSLKGQEGWVYGDGLAVIVPEDRIDSKILKYHKKKFSFGNGFEKTVLWIGGIEGRDNFHQKDFLNPPYKEYYIVLSNERGNCVFVNLSGENARGQMELRYFQFLDTTGDEIPELLLQTSSFSVGHDLENRSFEIYSFQSSGLIRIFEEQMSLAFKGNTPSPALFKHVEVDEEIIRIAYVDYLSCKNSNLKKKQLDFDKQKEHCLEYVTYTYSWNERTRQYRTIYKESYTAPMVSSKKDFLILKNEPSIVGKRVGSASRFDQLEVLKLHERTVLENGVKKIVPYFYVQLRNGTSGYVEAREVNFVDIEHAELLNTYYKTLQPDLKVWKTKEHFLKVVGDNRSSYSGASHRNQ